MKKQETPLPIEDIKSMNDKQMMNNLIELYNSSHWQALKRFIDMEIIKVENTLCTVDLTKELSTAVRSQGIRAGLLSLVRFIEDEVKNRKNVDKDGNKIEDYTPHY